MEPAYIIKLFFLPFLCLFVYIINVINKDNKRARKTGRQVEGENSLPAARTIALTIERARGRP